MPGTGFDQVTFAAKAGDGAWKVLGTDDAPNVSAAGRTFRVFHDLRGLAPGTEIAYKAVVKNSAGRFASATAQTTVGAEPSPKNPARSSATGWSCTTSATTPRTTTAGACTSGATSRTPPSGASRSR
ncbi:hypothetical protein ACFQX6_01855 [Streptosporangium lutulentum]